MFNSFQWQFIELVSPQLVLMQFCDISSRSFLPPPTSTFNTNTTIIKFRAALLPLPETEERPGKILSDWNCLIFDLFDHLAAHFQQLHHFSHICSYKYISCVSRPFLILERSLIMSTNFFFLTSYQKFVEYIKILHRKSQVIHEYH